MKIFLNSDPHYFVIISYSEASSNLSLCLSSIQILMSVLQTHVNMVELALMESTIILATAQQATQVVAVKLVSRP